MEDRHSQAYAVLFETLAEQIVANLNRPSGKSGPPAYEDARCLGCHTSENRDHRQGHEFVADGVGCEACHGPAEHWLARHTARQWKPEHGMIDTENVAVRAQQCVKCHVGAGPRDDGATRDVNHDLIAAGHPRLAFELYSYLEAMPPHWSTSENDKPQENPLHVWSVGRVVALQAALDLRGQRWNAANATTQTSPVLQPVWPEFAELDCYSCHRPFQRGEGDNWPVAADDGSQRELGLPTRNLWYETMMDGVLPQIKPSRNVELAKLSEWVPWGEPKLADIQTAESELDGVSESLSASKDSAEKFANVIIGAKIDTGNWDQAAQKFLALAALAAYKLPSVKPEQREELESALTALKAVVQFRTEVETAGRPNQFLSPRNYSPEDFDMATAKLIELLNR